MSTNCNIGIENQDGSVEYIYCNFDGYIAGVGETLMKYYTTPERIREIISMGDISSLDKHIHPSPNKLHSFSCPQENVCIFYNRDRGDDKNLSGTYNALKYFEIHSEFLYLFTKGSWWYSTDNGLPELL